MKIGNLRECLPRVFRDCTTVLCERRDPALLSEELVLFNNALVGLIIWSTVTNTHWLRTPLVRNLSELRKEGSFSVRRDALARKEKILHAACELVVHDGTNLKLDKVADMAGVGIATLYRNYPTRNALILACLDRIHKEVVAQLNDARRELEDPNAEADRILREVIRNTIPAGINLLVPALIETPEDRLSEDLLAKKKEIVEALNALLEKSRELGFLHPTVTNNWTLNGLIQIYQAPAFEFSGENTRSDDDVEAMVGVFLEGCRVGLETSYMFPTSTADENS